MSRFKVVPAAYVIPRRDDQVLMQLRHNTGYMDDHWAAAAAGHVEADESVFEAAIRETFEEIGVTISADDLQSECAMHRTVGDSDANNERVDFFFSIRNWSGTPVIIEPDKAADLRWFDLTDLPPNVVPHERYVFDRLLTGLSPIVTFGFGPG